ncbi:DNA polymerase IV [Clostridium sp.]|uniref:DNA polymerase IV n=1 Tax=Clostridium sp. TaxID=1506 RepID=UPI002FC6E8CA
MEKVILHVDMDAFFAAVEVMDNPSLRGKAVIVGGISERGVVATCSYEARKYGIRSAMPTYIAKAKCPHGIFIYPRHYRYEEVSMKVFNILYSITNKVEPVSIDEAYLDITDLKMDPKDIATKIKTNVRKSLGLTISVGVSYNKFLAKLASDWKKPDGLMVITKEMIPKILFPLSLSKVHGLGEKSVKKLNNIGIFTVEQLYNLPQEFFYEYFGKFGGEIYERIRGEDNREVITYRERKSIGRETTLIKNTENKEELKEYLKEFANDIETNLEEKNISGKTITLKIKTASFESHTKSKTLGVYISSSEEIYREACKILDSIDLKEEIRLIGLSITSLSNNEIQQLTIF